MATTDKAAVVHLGAHKTGTSLVQHYLRDHPEWVSDHGVDYLSRSETDTIIGWGKSLVNGTSPLRARVEQFLSDPDHSTFLLSHENTIGRPLIAKKNGMYPSAGAIAEALKPILDGTRPRIIISIRPQHEFIESYYLQTIHQGQHHTFERWLSQFDLDRISWEPVISRLRETFGEDNVDIIDFKLIKHGQQAFIRRFLDPIDSALADHVQEEGAHNRSISELGLTMALQANPHLKDGWERKAMRKFLQRNFSNVDYPRPVLLSEDQRTWLKQRYAEEYSRLTGTDQHAATSDPGTAAR